MIPITTSLACTLLLDELAFQKSFVKPETGLSCSEGLRPPRYTFTPLGIGNACEELIHILRTKTSLIPK